MKPEDLESLGREVGKVTAELTVAIGVLFQALSKSPSFDNESFALELRKALEHPNATPIQKQLFKAILGDTPDDLI